MLPSECSFFKRAYGGGRISKCPTWLGISLITLLTILSLALGMVAYQMQQVKECMIVNLEVTKANGKLVKGYSEALVESLEE